MAEPSTQSEWIALLTPSRDGLATAPTREEAEAIGAHFERLVTAAEAGTAILFGRTTDEAERPPLGIVVFRAEGRVQAEAWMASDPAVRAGVMRCEVRPYRVAGGAAGVLGDT